jgi:L-ribulose-5-phosphate 3-epimerase
VTNPLITRREALALGAAAASTLALRAWARPQETAKQAAAEPLFKISLAQWSLHRMLQAGKLDHLDFPKFAKETFGIDAVEYVNAFFKAHDAAYVKELKDRCDSLGVKSLLIMCDGEGNLGDPDNDKRARSIENHRKWVEAAKALGCHSIRVNAASEGLRDEQERLAADGLRRLTELAEPFEINVIVENHGGLSSHGDWLAAVMKRVNHPRCGTLPDFGNFYEYDRYQGVTDLMPFAKAVSAKSHEFDESGNETRTDYIRMLRIVTAAGYKGYVGIEYEGEKHPEPEGIRLTKALLERVRSDLSARTAESKP